MLKAIIFDSDGVLVDSMYFQADAWAKAFRKLVLPSPGKRFTSLKAQMTID